jgi:hypothetical protein
MLGYPNTNVVAATSKKYGFPDKGQQNVCQNFAISKSKKQNVPKTCRFLATKKGERISIDISSVNMNSFGKSNFWLLIQDEFTGHIWSEFITEKSQLPQVMLHWIYNTQKEANFKIKTIRLDNSVENTACMKLIDQTDGLKIRFKFTALGTPEQNGKI